MLPDSVTVELDRKQVCTRGGGLRQISPTKNPLWGMPYGMPNLGDGEYRVLVQWLAQGAQGPPTAVPSASRRCPDRELGEAS